MGTFGMRRRYESKVKRFDGTLSEHSFQFPGVDERPKDQAPSASPHPRSADTSKVRTALREGHPQLHDTSLMRETWVCAGAEPTLGGPLEIDWPLAGAGGANKLAGNQSAGVGGLLPILDLPLSSSPPCDCSMPQAPVNPPRQARQARQGRAIIENDFDRCARGLGGGPIGAPRLRQWNADGES